MTGPRPHVVVIGGGITGLAAAHTLLTADQPPEVTVLEAGDRLGGKVQASPFAGLPSVESGADMFLARTPAAVDLAGRLGLAGELVPPAPGPAFIWSRGELHPLPDGLVLGAPAALWPMARTRLLSWRGKARVAIEPLLPRRDTGDALGPAVRRRFGDEVLERLVGPLIGGINAGDPDRLSLAGVTPQLADALAAHRSLLFGLRAQAKANNRAGASADGRPSPSPFLAPRAGVSELVRRLAVAVGEGGAEIRLGATVAAIEPRPARRWLVTLDGNSLEADAVILTVPATAAAPLVAPFNASSADTLRGIAYASVAIITVALDEAQLARPLAGSGYLVPRVEQRTITACSFASTKWPQWKLPGQVLLRVSAGRDGDQRALELDDIDLTTAVLDDLDRQLGVGHAAATQLRITRWWQAMPQYAPGHPARTDQLMASLRRDAPGLFLAGAAYKGLGLPACIAQAQAASRAALATVGRR